MSSGILNKTKQILSLGTRGKADDGYNGTFSEDMGYNDVEGDNSRWELATEDVLEVYENSLRGKKLTPSGRWITPLNAKPKLNDEGINDIMSDLRGIMHKGTYLGNIDKIYAYEETKAEARAFKSKLLYNLNIWKVDETQIKTIVLSYARQLYFCFTRPVNDLERKHRNKRFSMQEKYNHDEVKPDEIKM